MTRFALWCALQLESARESTNQRPSQLSFASRRESCTLAQNCPVQPYAAAALRSPAAVLSLWRRETGQLLPRFGHDVRNRREGIAGGYLAHRAGPALGEALAVGLCPERLANGAKVIALHSLRRTVVFGLAGAVLMAILRWRSTEGLQGCSRAPRHYRQGACRGFDRDGGNPVVTGR